MDLLKEYTNVGRSVNNKKNGMYKNEPTGTTTPMTAVIMSGRILAAS
jgi:hypothetical protein